MDVVPMAIFRTLFVRLIESSSAQGASRNVSLPMVSRSETVGLTIGMPLEYNIISKPSAPIDVWGVFIADLDGESVITDRHSMGFEFKVNER